MTDAQRAPAAWVDASSGASGDMLLGALLGAGVPLGVLAEAVEKVVPGQVTLTAESVHRGGFAATRCHVSLPPSRAASPPAHRTWRDVERLIGEAGLHEGVRSLAHDVFARLAEAEGRVHGRPAEDVHFHEVGALDAIADVVGVCAGFVHLGEPRLVVSPIALGGGTIESEHGRLPVPPPAVVELLRGLPSYGGPLELELCTPTGAALLATLADDWGAQPAMAVAQVGVGAGGRDPAGHANVLRLLLGEPISPATEPSGAVVLETNVDDLDPRIWPVVIAALLDAGAGDAWLTPIVMKKGRPAHTLSVLVGADSLEAVRREVYRHTSTIGMRVHPVGKHSLAREIFTVQVEGHDVAVKIARLEGEVVNVQPEFEDARRVASALDRAVKDVLAAARAAADARG